MSTQFERLNCGLIQVKLAGPASEMSFTGYGAVFGNLDSYGDVIQKGAFAKTIHEAKVSNVWPAILGSRSLASLRRRRAGRRCTRS